jgi:hypothetical protein
MSKVVINPNSSTNNPRIDFSNNVTSSFIDISNNDFEFGTFTGNIRLLTNNTNRLSIINNGNVGIGITNPLYTLDVSGTCNFRDNLACQGSFVGNLITAGVNWSSTSSGISSYSVCYGNGIFVTVPTLVNYIIYSTDGINWINSSLNISNLTSVCYGNGLFVTVGTNIIYYSTDAIIWTESPNFTGKNQSWWSVCYGNNMYVAVSASTGVTNAIYSYDGIVWTLSPNTDISNCQWSSVCYGYSNGSGRFVAVNIGGSPANNMMHSTNGVNWTPVVRSSKTSFYYNSCCYGNGYFVAIGKDVTSGTNHNIWISNDISNNAWRLISNTYVYSGTNRYGTVCYGNNYFVIVFGNTVIYSNDISNNVWKSSVINGITADYIKCICYGNGKFVVVQESGTSIATSGYPTTATNPGTNIINDIVYINKNISIAASNDSGGGLLFGGTAGNIGLICKNVIFGTGRGDSITSTIASFNWALFRSAYDNSLQLNSLYGYDFYVNSVSSLSGTLAMTINVNGNIGIGTATPVAALDVSGILQFKNITKIISGNTNALSVSDNIGDSLLNNTFATVSITQKNTQTCPFMGLIGYGHVWQIGNIYNGTFTANLGFFNSYFYYPTINGLVNYYTFDSNAYDYATGYPVSNCTLNGGATYDTTDYKVGSASLSLTATSSQYAQLSSGAFTVTSAGLSFACWFKSNVNSTYARIFDFGTGQASYNIIMFVSSTNSLYVAVYGNGQGTGIDTLVYTNNPNLNNNTTWFHVVWTLNPTGVWKIYINGVLTTTVTINATYPAITTRNSNYIGKSNWADPYFNGRIDDFRVYNRVLSDSDASYIYLNGTNLPLPCISFYSIYNNKGLANYYPFDTNANDYSSGYQVSNCTLNGGAVCDASDFKVGGGSLSITSASLQYAQINTNSFTVTSAGLSFACWFKLTGYAETARLFEFGNGFGTGGAWPNNSIIIAIASATGILFANVSVNSGTGSGGDLTNASVNTNTWFHVVWTLNPNGEWKSYINGVLLKTYTGKIYPNTGPRTYNFIGRSCYSDLERFYGRIDDFRIYNRVLSDSDAANIYSNTSTLVNSVGINTNSTSAHLDVSGNGSISSSLTTGPFVCNGTNPITVSAPRRWYITNATPTNYYTNPGTILGSTAGGGGFATVFYNDVNPTTNTDFNTTTATFTAPENGLYLFELNIFDNEPNNVGRRLQIRGNGVPSGYTYDSGQYLMFNQQNQPTDTSYTFSNTYFLQTGQQIYYYCPSNQFVSPAVRCCFYYYYTYTTLKIFKIR